MKKELNLVQVFVATKAFLCKEYFKCYSDELGIMHGNFAINKCKDRWQEEPETWDPAAWIDWMQAANQILNPDVANPAITKVTPLQGYQIMKKYIQNFAYEFEFQELIELFKKIDVDQYSDFTKTNYWKSWQLCVDATLENKLTPDGALLSLDSILSQQQAFEIMQLFLHNYFLKIAGDEQPRWLIDLQNITFAQAQVHVFCQTWFDVYQSFTTAQQQTAEITVLKAFNVMRIFFETFKTMNDDARLVTFLKVLEVRPDHIPLIYESLHAWIQAAYRVVIPD